MKNKKNISRILAIICVLAVVVSSVKLHNVAASDATTNDKSAPREHTILGIEEFTGKDTYTISEADKSFPISDDTLDGIMVDGIYNLSGSNIINIGRKAGGVHIARESDAMKILFVDNRGGSDVRYTSLLQVTSDDVGCALYDEDVRIKVGVQFISEVTDAGEVDVRLIINIGPSYEKIIEVKSVLASNLGRILYLNSLEGSSITVKKAIVYEQLGFVDFGITEDYTFADGYQTLSAGGGTLENVIIDGVYNLSGYPSIQFGENSKMRLQIHINGDYKLACKFLDTVQKQYVVSGTTGVYTTTDIGCNYLNTDVRIKVQFTVTNKDAEAGTGDLAIKVNIGPTWEGVIDVPGVTNIGKLTRTLTIGAVPSEGSSITLRAAMPNGVEVTPADFGIADGTYKYAGSSSSENTETTGTVLGIEQFTGQQVYTLEQGGTANFSAGTGNLNGVTIDGIYRLTMNPTIDYGGSRLFEGLQFQRTKTGAIFQFLNGYDCGSIGNVTFTPEETGGIYDTDVRIKVAYEFKATYTDTADLNIYVTVGKSATKTIELTGAKLSCLQRTIHMTAPDGALTLLSATEKKAAVSGELQNLHTQTESAMTLSNKVFAADVQFFGTDSELSIGGTGADEWAGVSLKRKSDNLFAFKSTLGLSEILIPAEKVGLRSTSEKFDLKISLECISGPAGEIDVKYGVWFNDKLYNNTYFYSYNPTSTFGAKALICCPNEYSAVYIATAEHDTPDNNTPYILEDFGLKDQVYDINTGLRNGSTSKTVGTIAEGGSSITGKISLQGNASLTLFGSSSNVWYGLRFSIVNNELAIQHTNPNVSAIDVRYSDIAAGEEFEFTVSEEKLDLDADGSADDIRLGIWVNKELYNEQYYYLLDFTDITRTALVYVGNQTTSNVTVKPSVTVEAYDLADTENGYLVSGKGTITVNNASAANGDILNAPGDYIIRCADKGAYVKYVALYKSGDVHADDAINVLDLVAANKASQGTKVATTAGQKAADIDNNNVINEKDCANIRDSLVGIVEDTGIDLNYLRLDFADFGIADGYTYAGGGKPFSAGSGTLNGVMIDGIYHLSGNASINIGGDWKGLQFQCQGDLLRYQFCDIGGKGTGLGEQNLTTADLGCEVFDTDVRIRVGFKYVSEVNTNGTEDDTSDDTVDVEIKVCIGKTYENVFTVEGVRTANLQRTIYAYAVDNTTLTDSAITFKEVVLEELSDKVSYLSYEDGVMPIGSFYGPYRGQDTTKNQSYDYITDEIYQLIQGVGVNAITIANMDYIRNMKDIKDSLALAEKYGVGMFVTDSRYNATLDAATLANYQKEFAEYGSYKGVVVVDEPFTEASKRYEAGKMMYEYYDKTQMLNSYSNINGLINIGPMGAGSASALYKQHAYDILKPGAKSISWDYYVFDSVTVTQGYANVTDYFRSIAIMRKMAMERDIPFWGYVQAGSNWEGKTNTNNSTPTEAELLWNVNTQLAYGVKGIQYFPLIQPAGFAYDGDGYDYERNGLIGANGVPTKWYYYAKEANEQIAAVDEYLMYAKSKDVLAVGSTAQTQTGIKKNTYGTLLTGVTASDGAIIGVFDYQGKTAFYVVNYDSYDDNTIDATYQGDEAADDITLTFGSEQTYSVVSTQLSTSVSTTSGSTCTLNLKNGGAALVILN